MRSIARRAAPALLAGGAALSLAAIIPATAGPAFAQASPGPTSTSPTHAVATPPIVVVPPGGCPTGYVPGYADGNPEVHAGEAEGYYIWHSRDGWHLRVTHPGRYPVNFQATIHATGDIVVQGGPDSDIQGRGTHTLQVHFTDYGGVQGVDFTASCAKDVSFNLEANGSEVYPNQVFLGQDGDHPTSVPFTIERLPYLPGVPVPLDAAAN